MTDPDVTRVLMMSVAASLLLFALLSAGVGYALFATRLSEVEWVDWLIALLGSLAVVGVAWLLFPAVTIAVSSLMLERVARVVERRHYPDLGATRKQNVFEGILNSLKFLIVVVLLNIVALPFLLIPPNYVIIFYTMNGYLIGREYYELVSLRRIDPDRMRYLRSEERVRLFLVGVIIAFLSLVPIVNLLVPVIATAFMVHVFEDMRRGLPPGNPA